MADELKQKESLPERQSGDGSLPEMVGLGQRAVFEARVTELENLLAQKEAALAEAGTRVVELEQAVAGKDGEIATLNQAKAELEVRLTTVSSSLAEAVASYKTLVVQANPEVIEELIGGDTIAAIDDSLSQAKTLVTKVRQGVEAEILSARVPAGAPERAAPDLSALSPREKIQYAIGRTG